jgi:GNAT superfamily N-acetyltransferase
MDARIRTATIEDAGAIAHVQVESWKTTYAGIMPDVFLSSLKVEDRAERWRELIWAGDALNFVAEEDNCAAGFVSGGPLRETIAGYDAELYAIYLLKHHQRRGLGRALVHMLAKAFLSQGHNTMIVWVLTQNPAVSFYQRLGGVQIAQKTIEIGGASLEELAFGWASLDDLAESANSRLGRLMP